MDKLVFAQLVSKFAFFKELKVYRVKLNRDQVTSSKIKVLAVCGRWLFESRSQYLLTRQKLFVVALSPSTVPDPSPSVYTVHK
jgi:hypothetical protein